MKPPICAICGIDFRNDLASGGSVSFKLTKEQSEYNRRFKEEVLVGHPRGTEWFCSRHIVAAKKNQHLTISAAIDKIISKESIFKKIMHSLFKKLK